MSDAGHRVPEPLRSFVELVNRGDFWDSHELLEGPWRETGSDFYQGLILYASAFVHARRGNPHGIAAQLEKAEGRLADYPATYLGLDLREIREHARSCRAMVQERRAEADVDWEEVVAFPRLELQDTLVRGDEPELV